MRKKFDKVTILSVGILIVGILLVGVLITKAARREAEREAERDYIRRGPPSRTLLNPIVDYYEKQVEGNNYRFLGDIRRAGGFAWLATQHLVAGARDTRLWLRDPSKVDADGDSFWRAASFEFRDCGQNISSLLYQLRDARLNSVEATYHSHLKEYYWHLLNEHVTELPPFPADLEAERLVVQRFMRWRYEEPELELDQGPPIALDPNGSKRVLSKRRQAFEPAH